MSGPILSLSPPAARSIGTALAPAVAAAEREPEVVRLAAGAARGLGLARLGADCLQRIATAPESLFANPIAWCKQAADRRVALIAAFDESNHSVWCCKESLNTRVWVRFVSRYSSLRSWNAFRQGLLFRRAGISTPQPLAVVETTRVGVQREYLLTEAVDGARSLHKWLGESRCGSHPSRFACHCHRLATQLGRELRLLHQHRFDHRDLKATNILLSPDDRVWLIDLDGVRRWPLLPRFRRVQNLARLWAGVAVSARVSATVALRFLFEYLTPAERPRWKGWWRDVARRAARKIGQQKRKGVI